MKKFISVVFIFLLIGCANEQPKQKSWSYINSVEMKPVNTNISKVEKIIFNKE